MYNQKYHPFSTFYNHKFGFHITAPRPEVFSTALHLKPKVIKTLDFTVDMMKKFRREIPDLFLIGRRFVHPQDFGQLSGRTAQVARERGREMADLILREEVNRDIHHIDGRPIFHAWESLNEVFPENSDDDTHKLFDEYQVAFGEKMRAAGFEPLAFNFGSGNGRGQQWLKLYPGTLEFYKYLGFHEYDWPTMDRLHRAGLEGRAEAHNRVPGAGEGRGNDGMWLCLRYRRIMNEGIRQKYGDKHVCIITECGMTQGIWGGRAEDVGPWAKNLTIPDDELIKQLGRVVSVPIPEKDYWQTLLWYNSELMKDDYVMGACLFVTGATGQWETFEHLGGVTNRLAEFQQKVDLPTRPTTTHSSGTIIVPNTGLELPASLADATPSVSRLDLSLPASLADATPSPVSPLDLSLPAWLAAPGGAPQPATPKKPAWSFNLTPGTGLPLLVGDIGLPNETITVLKPNGTSDRLRSGSKAEYGVGGFETYANIPGMYRVQFLDQTFEIPLSGRQFTKVTFYQAAS
jgi:hypothetical protein